MLNIISLGAGVQSSTMALMAAHGEITPMPDCAIFADTQAEPEAIYTWLAWLEKKLPFPVHRVTAGSLVDAITGKDLSAKNSRWARPPFYVINTKNGKNATLRRQCTKYYKLIPIIEKYRELCGRKKGTRAKEILVTQWIGISTDEAGRMKPARDKWIKNRWPLIDMNMSRDDCLEWMKAHDYPKPAKSACTFCPYHSNAQFKEMRDFDPKGWQQAVSVDSIVRRGMPGVNKGEIYVHKSMVPLDQVDFRSAEDAGQLSMFGNECEGMCGV